MKYLAPLRTALYLAFSATPALLFAQEMGFDSSSTQWNGGLSFSSLVYSLVSLIDKLVILVVAMSVLVFFWGMAMFIVKSGDSKSHERGRDMMLWGIIIFFVMGSLWGIVKLVTATIF